MAPNLSVQQKDRIQQQVFNETPVNVIAHIEYIHKTTVYRIIDNLLAFGSHTTPLMRKIGRPFAVPPIVRIRLRGHLQQGLGYEGLSRVNHRYIRMRCRTIVEIRGEVEVL